MDETTMEPGHPEPQTRVLIVDADPGAREALSEAVTRLGHEVCHAAEPGPSALDLPGGQVPGLALIGLGADEAIETAEQVVARYGAPVVYATETTDAALLERAERTGPHGYLLKPVDGPQLGLTIRAALGVAARARAERERHGRRAADLRDVATGAQRRADFVENIFDNMLDAIVVADKDGNFEAINEPSREILTEFRVPDIREWYKYFVTYRSDGRTPYPVEDLPLMRALRGETTRNVRLVLRPISPEVGAQDIWMNATGYPLTDTDGQIQGGVVVLRDITDSVKGEAKAKEVEAELFERVQVLDTIIRSMGDGVVVANADAELTIFNPSAERMLGMGAVDNPPEEWSDAYGIFYPDAITPVPMEDLPLVCAMRGEEIEGREVFIRNPAVPDGVYINVNASPLRDEKAAIIGSVAVFRNVTQHRMEAEALTQAFAHGRLEVIDTVLHNIGNAINSVATGTDTLYRWFDDNQLLLRFEALEEVVAAHERDWTSWLEHDAQGRQLRPFLLALLRDLAGERRRLLKTSSRVRERVRHIVDIIRTQASFTDSTMERQLIDLPQTLKRVAAVVQDSLGQCGTTVEVECAQAPAEILVQESKFQQMFVNLIKNAAEATEERASRLENDPGWRPEVRVIAHGSGEDGTLAIDVIDNGIGIEPSRVESIFNAGYTTKNHGSGLGLHSAANFVIGSGGKIQVQSDGIGHGTTMRVTLRIAGRTSQELVPGRAAG